MIQRELTELNRNQRFLETLRANLHLLAGRRQDVIAFDLQAPLAKSMGIETDSSRQASEAIMRRYYWAAKAVTQQRCSLAKHRSITVSTRVKNYSPDSRRG